MQLEITDLPDFQPRHRIGIKNRGLILRSDGEGPLTWSWARWSIVPPGAKGPPTYPLNNARSDKLNGWPWKATAPPLPDTREWLLGAREAGQGDIEDRLVAVAQVISIAHERGVAFQRPCVTATT